MNKKITKHFESTRLKNFTLNLQLPKLEQRTSNPITLDHLHEFRCLNLLINEASSNYHINTVIVLSKHHILKLFALLPTVSQSLHLIFLDMCLVLISQSPPQSGYLLPNGYSPTPSSPPQLKIETQTIQKLLNTPSCNHLFTSHNQSILCLTNQEINLFHYLYQSHWYLCRPSNIHHQNLISHRLIVNADSWIIN